MKLLTKINYIIILFSIAIPSQTLCQIEEVQEHNYKKNSVFIEGLGHGIIYSVNYERVLFNLPITHTTCQVGIAYYGKNNYFHPYLFPISINQSITITKNEFIEIGFGKLLAINRVTDNNNGRNDFQVGTWIIRLGLKYHFKNSNWLCKIAYTPFYQNKSNITHSGGVAFGYRF